jgi:sec-independent protein translocase protein TatC
LSVPLTARRAEPEQDVAETPRLQKPILEYLDDFRRRIMYSAVAVGVGTIAAFTFIDQIFSFVFAPIRSVLPPGSKLIYTQPSEAFSVYVQIALIAGVVLASPAIMFQVWRFVAPALYTQERRFALPFIGLTTIGFIAGALFNHYVVFKLMIAFFGSFDSPNLSFLPRLDDVFGLYTKMLFIMGLVFQMPTVVFFLAKMGVVTARWLASNLKYAILGIFIVSAVITPTADPYNQTILAVPMVVLYLLSIVIAWIFGPVARRAGESEPE